MNWILILSIAGSIASIISLLCLFFKKKSNKKNLEQKASQKKSSNARIYQAGRDIKIINQKNDDVQPEIQISDQAISILKQLIDSGGEGILDSTQKGDGSSLLIIGGSGGHINYKEIKFLQDDLSKLVETGLLKHNGYNSQELDKYAITRDGEKYIRALQNNTDKKSKTEIQNKTSKIIENLNTLDNDEKSVLREFYIQEKNTISLPINNPTVAGLMQKEIINRVGNIIKLLAGYTVAPTSISEIAKKHINPGLIDFPKGNVSSEKENTLNDSRPKFIWEIDHYENELGL